MTKDHGSNPLDYWLKLFNRHSGYGGVFNYHTQEDKTIVEMATAREWCVAMQAAFCVDLSNLRRNRHDPPDCFVDLNGTTLSVELVQLVDPEHKRRADKERKDRPPESPYQGQLFLDMQWSPERLKNRMNDLIQLKGSKYNRKNLGIDVLLVHTDETWLSFDDARKWKGTMSIQRHPNIQNVFLIFTYDPKTGQHHWPLLQVYGDLHGNISTDV